ncbi:MAG: CocE/NonD family hydrolase [Cyanothece sp. SIO1E1]|nr:CocE/NonD family hydrolase [Cyanothece sp. SIO1E1]
MLPVSPRQTRSMLTRDGVRLDADVYCPDVAGDFPVLLMRQPYGRAIASTVVYAHPSWYAAHGYIVVIQDVRGRGSSAGEFALFAHEVEDGYDTLTWAASLPHSTGQVGMYGFSYQGMTQLYAAMAQPTALKALCPAMVGYDLYQDWAYEGGAFCLQTNLGWAIQLAAETARRQNNPIAYQKLYAAARNLPLYDSTPTCPEILKTLAPNSFYHQWLKHPEPDPYWQRLSPQLNTVDLPMLHIGGWFDTYLRGTIRLYKDLASQSTCPQQLWVGPWAHLPWGRQVGAVNYGPAAASPIDHLQIRWFDHFLKGMDTGLLSAAPIALFELGSNQWRTFETWPQGELDSYFLSSTGLATISEGEGKLIKQPTEFSSAIDTLVHDPWRPVPSIGGHASLPAGSFDRAGIDCRSDVITYTTDPLTAAMHLAGEITVQIDCSADAPSFDLCAVLSDVHPEGRVYNLTQGYLRIDTKADVEMAIGQKQILHSPTDLDRPIQSVAIALQPICAQISSGHTLRLSISAACFPAYAVNPGTGLPPSQNALIDAKIITLTIYSGGDHRSQILLPRASF